MTTEKEFAAEVAADYFNKGWEIESPRQAIPFIKFEPDLLLRRGEEYLVVEIKRPGVTLDRSIAEIRRVVEKLPNWRLEVKLLPPNEEHARHEVAHAETPVRLKLAERLLDSGQLSDGVLIAWVVIEASLRKLSPESQTNQRIASVPELLRSAYESEAISDSELRKVQRAYALRSRIVHGFVVQLDRADAVSVLALARELADHVEKAAH